MVRCASAGRKAGSVGPAAEDVSASGGDVAGSGEADADAVGVGARVEAAFRMGHSCQAIPSAMASRSQPSGLRLRVPGLHRAGGAVDLVGGAVREEPGPPAGSPRGDLPGAAGWALVPGAGGQRGAACVSHAPGRMVETICVVRKAMDGKGRLRFRYSGTEPLLRIMIEGENDATIKAWAEDIAAAVKTELAGA